MNFAILPTHLSEILPTTVDFLQQSIPSRAPRAIYNKKQRAFFCTLPISITPLRV